VQTRASFLVAPGPPDRVIISFATNFLRDSKAMHWTHRVAVSLGAFLFATSAPLASAHNLYVLIEEQSSSADVVDVIFEHSPYPGKGTYNGPLIERGKTWVTSLDGKTLDLAALKEKRRLGKKFLQTRTEIKGPRAIIHSCQWACTRAGWITSTENTWTSKTQSNSIAWR
jgi:hypothetical protein